VSPLYSKAKVKAIEATVIEATVIEANVLLSLP
jgi:hypothetical protein